MAKTRASAATTGTATADSSPVRAGAPGLTPRQQRFVAEYLREPNATKAAVAAGYSAKTAHSAGPRLLANVGVLSAIEAGQKKQARKLNITAERVLRGLYREARGLTPDTKASARVAAWGLLGKHLKLFVDQVHHTGDIRVVDPYAKPPSDSEGSP